VKEQPRKTRLQGKKKKEKETGWGKPAIGSCTEIGAAARNFRRHTSLGTWASLPVTADPGNARKNRIIVKEAPPHTNRMDLEKLFHLVEGVRSRQPTITKSRLAQAFRKGV